MYFASPVLSPSLLYCLSVSSSLFSFHFTRPSGFSSASWWTPGAAPWGGVVTTACGSSSRPGSARRPPGSPADWSRDTNWLRLLRWWKEKAWPADWWKWVRRELSSSGKTHLFYKKLTCIVSYLHIFSTSVRWLDISFPPLLASPSPKPSVLIFERVNVCPCMSRHKKNKNLLFKLQFKCKSFQCVLTLKRHVQLWFAIGTVKATSLTDVKCVKVTEIQISVALNPLVLFLMELITWNSFCWLLKLKSLLIYRWGLLINIFFLL